MIGLAIHTSSPSLGLAISDFAGQTRHQTWDFGRDLSAHLHYTLMEFMQPCTWTDLSFIAVAQGPGGFTGTRIGVVTARTLAQQLALPLFGISTLAAIAQAAVVQQHLLNQQPIPSIAVDMRAQRDMRFTAIYQPEAEGLRPLQTERVVSPDAWADYLSTYPTPLFRITATDAIANTVPQVLELAHGQWRAGQRPHWADVVPYYGQHPVD